MFQVTGYAVVQKSNYLLKLTPQNSVLVLIDHLTGFLPGLKSLNESTYKDNVTALTKLGSIFELPMIVLSDEGSFRGHFFSEIAEYLVHGQHIELHTPSAWHEDAFVKALQQFNRPKVIMAGISIDNCLMQTALDVLRAGYEVYVVVDASGTKSQLVETAAMLRLTQAGAVMTNWVLIASELLDDWNNPQAEAVGELYQKHSKWGGNFILRKLKQLQ